MNQNRKPPISFRRARVNKSSVLVHLYYFQVFLSCSKRHESYVWQIMWFLAQVPEPVALCLLLLIFTFSSLHLPFSRVFNGKNTNFSVFTLSGSYRRGHRKVYIGRKAGFVRWKGGSWKFCRRFVIRAKPDVCLAVCLRARVQVCACVFMCVVVSGKSLCLCVCACLNMSALFMCVSLWTVWWSKAPKPSWVRGSIPNGDAYAVNVYGHNNER